MYQYTGKYLWVAITSVCSSGFLLFGYDQGVMSGIITGPVFLKDMGNPSSTVTGTIVSIFQVGAFFGAIFTFLKGETMGRRKTLIYGSAADIVGAILQCSAYGQAQMFVGRIISGLGIGMLTSAVPVYQSEIMLPGTRGIVGAALLSIVISGLVIAYWLDYGLSFVATSIQWRLPIGFQLIFAVYAGVGALFLPDTPRWLHGQGRREEAIAVLSALRCLPPDDDALQREYADMAAALELEREAEGSSWSDVFRDNGIKGNRRVLLAMGAQIMQQGTGINVALFYAPTIFQDVLGMTHELALLLGGVLQTWWLICSFLTWYLIDRYGRRRLYMTMAVGMSLCMTGLAVSVWANTYRSGIAAAIFLFLFESFFVWGWHSGIWIYPPEILPFKLRAKGSALATSMNWLGSFIIGETSKPGFQNLGFRFYIIFAVFNLSFIPIVYIWYPETAGKTLESIDLIFTNGRYNWLHLDKDARTVVRNANERIGETSTKMHPGKSAADVVMLKDEAFEHVTGVESQQNENV